MKFSDYVQEGISDKKYENSKKTVRQIHNDLKTVNSLVDTLQDVLENEVSIRLSNVVFELQLDHASDPKKIIDKMRSSGYKLFKDDSARLKLFFVRAKDF
jgi:transcriptional regulator of NAD metabolism